MVVTQPVVATQPVVFRDRPVTVVDSNGQQVQCHVQGVYCTCTCIAGECMAA